MRFDWAILIAAILAVPLHAQVSGVAAVKAEAAADVKALSLRSSVALSESSDLVGGTLIGYAARTDIPGVYPLHGFPGAAFPGPTLALADAAGRPVVSSVGGYALAAGERPGDLLVYGLRPNAASGRLLPSTFAVSTRPDQIILSPLGRVVLLYDRGRREVEVLAGLPGRPVSLYKVSLAGLHGVLTALAVSDDGSVGLAAFSSARGSGEIYALHQGTEPSLVGAVSRVVHLAFVPDSRDGLAADYERSQVLLLRDGGRQGIETLAGRNDGVVAPTAVEASTAGTVFVVNAGSETVVVVPPGQSAPPGLIHCGCTASELERLKGPDSFRLTSGAGVTAVLEGRLEQPGVFYIPAGDEMEREISSGPTPGRGRSR